MRPTTSRTSAMPHTHEPTQLIAPNQSSDVSSPGHDDETPLDADGVDRRNFLSCMAWVGTGLLWTISGGVPTSARLGAQEPRKGDLFFMQISDSHIGFDKPANT